MSQKKFIPKRTQPKAQMMRDAIRRLRERWEQEHEDETWEPEKEPVVTPMFTAVEGGIEHVFDALRAHDDDDARAFVETYERCGFTDRKYVPLEAVAFAAGIGSLRLAEVAQTAIFLYDGMRSKMLLASGLPSIVQQSIRQAKTPKGLHDREMMLKAGGILPTPKGAQIAIQNVYADKEPQEASPAAWRNSEERLREIHDLTAPKRLPSPESRPILVGGHIDRLQEETINIVRGE